VKKEFNFIKTEYLRVYSLNISSMYMEYKQYVYDFWRGKTIGGTQ